MTHCHASAYGGPFSTDKTMQKILQVVLYWQNLFKYVYGFIKRYGQCQRTKNILKRNEMHLDNILEVKIFYVRGIDFMRSFSHLWEMKAYLLFWTLFKNSYRSLLLQKMMPRL